jgi:hypothetical protein
MYQYLHKSITSVWNRLQILDRSSIRHHMSSQLKAKMYILLYKQDSMITCTGHVKLCILLCRCSCGHCRPMRTGLDSICCGEREITERKAEDAGVACVALHHSFIANCLNRDVIEVSVLEFAQTDGPLDDNQPPHKYVLYCTHAKFNDNTDFV